MVADTQQSSAHAAHSTSAVYIHTPVIFAEPGEPSLLGVVSLEEAALAVDPLAGRLIPANLLRL